MYVAQGTLLGYQGNYSGDPNNPTGVHLHFSIVKDDGKGGFLNRDKSPEYSRSIPISRDKLNANDNPMVIPNCE